MEIRRYSGWRKYFTWAYWKMQILSIMFRRKTLNIVEAFEIETDEPEKKEEMDYFAQKNREYYLKLVKAETALELAVKLLMVDGGCPEDYLVVIADDFLDTRNCENECEERQIMRCWLTYFYRQANKTLAKKT